MEVAVTRSGFPDEEFTAGECTYGRGGRNLLPVTRPYPVPWQGFRDHGPRQPSAGVAQQAFLFGTSSRVEAVISPP